MRSFQKIKNDDYFINSISDSAGNYNFMLLIQSGA